MKIRCKIMLGVNDPSNLKQTDVKKLTTKVGRIKA